MKLKYTLTLSIATSVLFLYNCGGEKKETLSEEQLQSREYDLALQDKLAEFGTLPKYAENPANEITPEKIQLGHVLYFDNRLSKDGNISCNSCHNLATFGVDNLPTSPGDAGKNGDRNSPTTLNAALHSMQFWDGRAKDVEEQAGMPVLNPIEMAIPSKQFLVERLSKIDLYKDLFKRAYPNENNPITYENIEKAIAAFERTLITPSRFDEYLAGNMDALTLEEKRGLMTFITRGCNTCHNGNALGGKSLQKFGAYADYWEYTKSEHIDKGLGGMSGNASENFIFKVPSLRNIAKTGPYFHDGSIKDLGEAIKIMAKIQLNADLSETEVNNLVAFLGALTGEVPTQFQKAPVELTRSLN
jgi:cytochrome c peroxidase